MKVYKITLNDDDKNMLYDTELTILDEAEVGDTYTVEIVLMDEDEYYKLPEFQGF